MPKGRLRVGNKISIFPLVAINMEIIWWLSMGQTLLLVEI